MGNERLTLEYLNEDDRAYGLAGMAISLAAMDAMELVSYVTLDSDDEPMVTFSHAYYFSGCPSISPKATWANMIRNFKVTTAMAVSNLMARGIVRMHEDVPFAVLQTLRDKVVEEGRESCSLDDDETGHIFDAAVSNYRRLYRNPRIHPAVDEFVRILSRRRRLSGMEIIDELHYLQLL